MAHYDEISGRTIKNPVYSKPCDIKIGENGTINDFFDSSGNLIPQSERTTLYIKKDKKED